MALGGGTWNTQNKVLPGAYINVSGKARASAALSDRGIAALPLRLDWGPEDTVFAVTAQECRENCLALFGHAYTDDEMLPLREVFQHASTLYAYRLESGGTKAENDFCTAKYPGAAGNELSVVISVNADEEEMFDVSTYFRNTCVETQTVANAEALKDNALVSFKADTALSETAKTPLTGGTNGQAENSAYQAFLDKLEGYSFHVLGCPTEDAATISLFVNYTKRMRDEAGAKFQTVIYNLYGEARAADYEGIIAVGNTVAEAETAGKHALIYWVTGAEAGCAVEKTCTNMRYDGALTVIADHTQAALEKAAADGRLMLHNVNGEIRILDDCNALVTLSEEKTEDFRSNQTIRVCDQIANDVAVLFATRYLGVVPNDNAGRIALWNDICKLLEKLAAARAIENFVPESVSVEEGENKKAVLCTISGLQIVNAMAQLYMHVIVM